jgi:hypothetical protein
MLMLDLLTLFAVEVFYIVDVSFIFFLFGHLTSPSATMFVRLKNLTFLESGFSTFV